jgi:hypothetical protein
MFCFTNRTEYQTPVIEKQKITIAGFLDFVHRLDF